MASLANINIRFAVDLKEFSTEMQNSLRTIDKWGQKLQNVGAGLTVGVTAPIVAFGVASVLAFDQSAQAIAQVDAALKSTGGTVGYNSEQLQKMAADLQGISTFDDDEILRKATANILTFSNITGQTFQDAQVAALDLATRLDGDLQSASIQVGKALNDPIKGVAALSKVGVSFSGSQKAMIKSMVETNDLGGAQAIILKELQKEFGGSAEAAAKAGSGPMKQLGNQIGDLSEEFGKIILEGMKPFIGFVKGIVASLQGLSPAAKTTIVVVAGLVAVIGPLLLVIGGLLAAVPLVVAGFVAVQASIVPILAGVTLLYGAVLILKNAFSTTAKASDDLNKAISAGNKTAVSEVVSLDSLYAAATNVKLSTEKRKAAIDQLQALYPAYFRNIDDETIKNGKAEVSYNQLRNAIFNKARATAIDNELQKKANDRITKEIELQEDLVKKRKNLIDVQKNAKDENVSLSSESGASYIYSKEQQIKDAALAFKKAKIELANFTSDSLKSDEILLNAKSIYDSKLEKLTANEVARQKAEADASAAAVAAQGAVIASKAGTIDFYNKQIEGLRKLQETIPTTNAAWKTYENQIDAIQKKIDKIQTGVVPINLAKPQLPQEVDFEAPVLNIPYYEEQIARYKELQLQFSTNNEEGRAKYQAYADAISNTELIIQDIQGVDNLIDSTNVVKTTIFDLSTVISDAVTQLAENAAVGFGEAIGGVIAGTQTLGSLFSGMLGLVANFMKDLGKQLIAIGIARIAFDKLKFSGVGAIAAGVALIALSTVISSKFEKAPAFANGGIVGGQSFYGDKILARVNSGELILNNKQQKSVLGAMANGGGVGDIYLSGGFDVSGDKLKLVIERAEMHKKRLG